MVRKLDPDERAMAATEWTNIVSQTCPPKLYTPVGSFLCLWPHIIEKTAGGLIIPAGAAAVDSSPTATVISVGPDCKLVKEGDIVTISSMIPFQPVYVRKWKLAPDDRRTCWAYVHLQEELVVGVLTSDQVKEMEAAGIVVR